MGRYQLDRIVQEVKLGSELQVLTFHDLVRMAQQVFQEDCLDVSDAHVRYQLIDELQVNELLVRCLGVFKVEFVPKFVYNLVALNRGSYVRGQSANEI